nr:hypothetical protein [Candidatus Calescibacterium sp.]
MRRRLASGVRGLTTPGLDMLSSKKGELEKPYGVSSKPCSLVEKESILSGF